MLWFQALSSRRFQLGSDRVKLLRPTLRSPTPRLAALRPRTARRTCTLGLTLVPFPAQLERFVWNGGCT